jgi:hypothetical protein
MERLWLELVRGLSLVPNARFGKKSRPGLGRPSYGIDTIHAAKSPTRLLARFRGCQFGSQVSFDRGSDAGVEEGISPSESSIWKERKKPSAASAATYPSCAGAEQIDHRRASSNKTQP